MTDFRFAADDSIPSVTPINPPVKVQLHQPTSHEAVLEHIVSHEPVTRPEDPRDESAARLVDNLLEISQKLRGLLQQHYNEFDLNEVRYTVLQFINQTKEAGCSQAELADKLQQSESSVSTLIERMKNSDLIYPLRSKQDRRKRILVLTDHGRELLKRIEDCHAMRMRVLLEKLQLSYGHELVAAVQEMNEKLEGVSGAWFKQITSDRNESSQAA
ncbi:MarR family protein [Polystyrenella longa]|uniref:MarR family protein n=1 Tax=Polystyrenella longa TaxID=2528007 RepID=A0A518CHG1_9PLAN|nr:MarR family winged helix-turn-helix transcriptional regulator [Polystyrenella longa]QDU78663.1 MarR family protein [Polystyrenella longa]